jgi:hypothetical protein
MAHALVALGMQALVALPLALALRDGVAALAGGTAAAIGFYLGRERRQSEEWAGSNRIPPWVWRPRALRDLAWPALAVLLAVALAAAWGF